MAGHSTSHLCQAYANQKKSLRGGGLHSGIFTSIWLDGCYPPTPYSSPDTLNLYLNWWLVKCRPTYNTPRFDLILDPFDAYVFTHQDLVPRNMIVDENDKLWLVDWGRSGYYPPYMEYAGMLMTKMPCIDSQKFSVCLSRWRWNFFRWMAVGSFTKSVRAL